MHLPADDRTLANLVSKLAASLMTALSVLLVFGVVRRMLAHLRARPDDVGSTARAVTRHETRVALIAALAYGLGTPVWSTAAQAMWSHTPAVLGYALMLWALLANAPIIAGAAAAAAAVARPATAPAAAISMLYLAHRAWRHARRDGSRSTAARAAFMPALHGFFAAAVVGGLGLAYNLRIFGNAGGGAPIRAAPGLDDLGATGMFSGSILEGLAGLVISPRGILIFSPIVIVGIAAAAWAWTRRVSSPDTATERDEAVLLARYSSIAAAVTLLVYAKYVVWWGGHAFGPRYLTDVMPFVGLLMGLGLSRVLAADSLAPVAGTPTRRPGTIAALVVATLFVYSAAVQAIGAFCWPSAWTLDKNPPYRERLWDWRRNEIVECIRSGPRLDPMARRLLARLSGNLGE
jgi:hypothetical protein